MHRNFDAGFLETTYRSKLLEQFVWQEYAHTIRVILNNEYIFPDFWHFQNGDISDNEWRDAQQKSKHAANTALSNQDTATVLAITLSRLYVLRNQIMHGGATYNSQTNRQQLTDCTRILGRLVPLFIIIMMSSNHTLWGDAAYPVV